MDLFVIQRYRIGPERTDFLIGSFGGGSPVFTPLVSHGHRYEKQVADAWLSFLTRHDSVAEFKIIQAPPERRAHPLARQRGFGMIEMLCVMTAIAILSALAVPNVLTMIQYTQRHEAFLQVERIRNAEAEWSICAAQQLPCPAIVAQIPPAGSITTGGYSYTYTPSGTQTVTTPSSYSCYSDRGSGAPAPPCPLDSGGYIQPPCSWASQAGAYWTGSCQTTTTTTTVQNWSYLAVPVSTNWSFFTDATGVVRYSDSSPASASSPLLP